MDAEILNYRKEDVKVTVSVAAYNHAPYIRQTIESILNQERDFSLQILINDDASTDGTTEIIRAYAKRYPDVITAIIQRENTWRNNQHVLRDRIKYVNGQYYAPCDGDDYWPTSDKLKKQVQFMETHPDVAGVGGITRYFDDNGNEHMDAVPQKKYRNIQINKKYFNKKSIDVGMGTLLIKSEIVKDENYLKARDVSYKVGDSILMANLFEHGDLYIMDEWYQYHRIQTRKNACNYNSIISTRQKFEDRIDVLNARVTCLKNQDMRKWYIQTASVFFWVFLRERDLKSFILISKKVVSEYQKYTLVAVLYTLFCFLPKNLVLYIKRKFG